MEEKMAREMAIKILEDSCYINEDYFKMEDFITDVIMGKDVTRPAVKSNWWYAALSELEEYIRGGYLDEIDDDMVDLLTQANELERMTDEFVDSSISIDDSDGVLDFIKSYVSRKWITD